MRSRGPYRVQTHGHARALGGLSPTYKVWRNMVQRCRRQVGAYRGVSVCERWRESFSAFLEDMGERPTAGHSIDRIDSAGDYEPRNCRWATAEDQARNRRSVRHLTHPDTGETMCLTEWARRLGLRKSTLHYRVTRWPLRRALSEPARVANRAAADLLGGEVEAVGEEKYR
ncbi:MAG: hypothetical protein AAF715_28705 [Myxococcota bacterium]